jgi:hypothetical protein
MNMLFAVLIYLIVPSGDFNATTRYEKFISIGKELASQYLSVLPARHYERHPDSVFWVLVDSFDFSDPLLNSAGFAIHNSDWHIVHSILPDTLTNLAQVAVSTAPLRLRNSLVAAFHRLDTLQDSYAQLILDAPSNCVDEVVFQICHIGSEILSYPGFDPDLLIVNAELLYEIDDSLPYADIIEHSLPNGDYYSTVSHRILISGDSVWVELPWEIYYNYIVHPIITDEFPDMSSYVYSKFWREYLFYDADSGYPNLGEKISDAKILWNREKTVLPAGRPFTQDDCALDVIANWATYTVPVLAQGNRPIQPNIIAHEHDGNCGELQDLLTAGARACLVPCVGATAPCEDHVWSEFYDDGFYPYQVDRGFGSTHIADTSIAYDEQYGGSKRVSAIFDWRSDGYWWTVTGKYSNSCSLYVYVYDLMGRPIDGASVTICSEAIYGGISTATRAYTDPEGECCFELGDLRNFYARVLTPIGSYPTNPEEVVQIIEYSQSGANYYKFFYITDYLPSLMCSDTTSLDSLSLWKFEVVLNPLKGQSSGNCITRYGPGDSIRVYRSFFEEYAKGNIDLMFVDDANLQKYISGEQFKAFDCFAAASDTFTFIAQDSALYHLIVSNEDVLYYTPFCSLKVNLYRNTVGIEEDIEKRVIVQGLPTIFKERLFFNLDKPSQIEIYEVSGRLVYASEKKVAVIDKHLSAGVYFVRITLNHEDEIRKCVIIK